MAVFTIVLRRALHPDRKPTAADERTLKFRRAEAVSDRHCAFPGCRRPAKWTDVHHIVAFKPGAVNGGRTDLDRPRPFLISPLAP